MRVALEHVDDPAVDRNMRAIEAALEEALRPPADEVVEGSGWVQLGQTLICYGVGAFSGSGVGWRSVTVVFPKRFAAQPAVIITPDWATIVDKHGVNGNGRSLTQVNVTAYCDTAGTGSFSFSWLAIGKAG